MKKYLRLFTIIRIAARYRLRELLAGLEIASPALLVLNLPVRRAPGSAKLNRGTRLRLALEELGPIFIKFGQLLSTRRDLIPADIADELAYLQDRVPPFPGDVARKIIEDALGGPVSDLFASFSSVPLASASIAQIHTATLHSGEEVVVKVIRPGIDKVIVQDVALLHRVAAWMEDYLPYGRRLRAREVVRDYEYVINDELNLLAEGANATQLARNFENSKVLYVPKVYWDYSRVNVLVMERIYGIPISHIEELKAADIDLKQLAETGVEIFFTQVFNHSFFHADMHPGNIFVSREDPVNPRYIALDCAIFGTLNRADQQYLARNLLAILKRDYRKVAELHVESGWVPPDTPVHAFEATMRSVCEPVFEKPLKDISFGTLLLQLFRTAGRFNMEVQPSLVLLQKTMLNIEGLGKDLYPDLDLWQTALPFLEDWQRRRLSPWHNLKKIKDKAPLWLEELPEIPELVHDSIIEFRDAQRNTRLHVHYQNQRRQAEKQRHRRRQFRLGIAAIAAAAVIGLTGIGDSLDNLHISAWILLFAGLGLIYLRR